MTELTPEQLRETAERFVAEAIRVWEHNASLGGEAEPVITADDDSSAEDIAKSKCRFAFELHLENVGSLTSNYPGHKAGNSATRMGHRLIWWPGGIERRRRISVVSSRLRERKDFHRSWFDALRTVAARCDSEQECLCVSDGTAAAEPVRRAAALFGLPIARLSMSAGQLNYQSDLVDWLQSAMTALHSTLPGNETLAIISPAYLPESERTAPAQNASFPDAALVQAADRVVVLSCRPNGNVHTLLNHRLASVNDGSVMVLSEDELTPAATRQSLADAGAVTWVLDGRQKHYAVVDSVLTPSSMNIKSTRARASSPLTNPDDWLCHWTRPCAGPWPDESIDNYLDALIMGCPSADHSAFAAIIRIIETRTLLTSGISHGAVSFTEVPLAEFRSRRVYRKHLRRYDFESWGIAVHKNAVEARGGRAVQYVADTNAEELTDKHEVWRFQPATDSAGKIDWTAEREWRLPRPLKLKFLSAEEICVFVDTTQEVQLLQNVSPWPVAQVPE